MQMLGAFQPDGFPRQCGISECGTIISTLEAVVILRPDKFRKRVASAQ